MTIKLNDALRFTLYGVLLLFIIGKTAPAAEPQTVLELKRATDTYFRNKNWTSFAAAIELTFYQKEELKSTCSGTLLFDPLKKKLIMECSGKLNQPVFVFRNDDLNFLLYLPGMRHAWQGDMFQLEYSPEFDSHLKPLDLYRAVSPEAFSEDQAISAYGMRDGMEIEIEKPYENTRYMARRLLLDFQGQVRNETFFTPDGTETTVVTRENFKQLDNPFDSINKVFYYAEQTSVFHPETGDKTVLKMTHVTLNQGFPEDVWVVSMPEDVPLDPLYEGKPVVLTPEQRADAKLAGEQ